MARNRASTRGLLVLVLAAATAGPVAAQTVGYLRFGNATYPTDRFCEDPTAALTMFTLGVSTRLFGVSAEFNNGDWPWPKSADAIGLTHGKAFQIMGEVTPLELIAPELNRYVRPFVGVGLHHSTDGDPRLDAGDTEVFGVNGQTSPFVAFGANAFIPLGSSRFGVTGGYRWTRIFAGDFELTSPAGGTRTLAGKTLKSRSWHIGLTLRLGDGD